MHKHGRKRIQQTSHVLGRKRLIQRRKKLARKISQPVISETSSYLRNDNDDHGDQHDDSR